MEILHQTLQDFFKRIGLPMQQFQEMTVHRLNGLHGDKPMSSPLFRTNYYSFLLIMGGKSQYTIDGLTFDLADNSFYFTTPGHLKSFKIDNPLQGYMLTFTEDFVKQYFMGDFFKLYPFLIQETIPVMQLQVQQTQDLANILEQMLKEYEGFSPYKNAILVSHLAILLFKTKELLVTHKVTSTTAHNRGAELVNGFKNSINENFKALALGQNDHILSVKEIAAKMNIHPNYLTNTIKTETGKSASEWIQERTISDAKALLLQSTKSVSEIAFALGFSDSTNFTKFFKKNTRLTPSEFRNDSALPSSHG
jgi:AraC family transcriptional regulator, transcriptional activator of pobA